MAFSLMFQGFKRFKMSEFFKKWAGDRTFLSKRHEIQGEKTQIQGDILEVFFVIDIPHRSMG